MMHLSIINTNLKPFSPSYYYIYFNVIVSYSCKSNYHAIPATTPPFIVMLAVNDTLHDILTWLTSGYVGGSPVPCTVHVLYSCDFVNH